MFAPRCPSSLIVPTASRLPPRRCFFGEGNCNCAGVAHFRSSHLGLHTYDCPAPEQTSRNGRGHVHHDMVAAVGGLRDRGRVSRAAGLPALNLPRLGSSRCSVCCPPHPRQRIPQASRRRCLPTGSGSPHCDPCAWWRAAIYAGSVCHGHDIRVAATDCTQHPCTFLWRVEPNISWIIDSWQCNAMLHHPQARTRRPAVADPICRGLSAQRATSLSKPIMGVKVTYEQSLRDAHSSFARVQYSLGACGR
mmetsp:Transcript_58660/g.134558  ORF Transcript_58660/g.134558 Transcript_58660/m.134558 type:complete len:249 (-) Transcript_58660:26-772(-)